MFYSLGELQLWVFGDIWTTSGRKIVIFVIFGRIFSDLWVKFRGVLGDIWGSRGGRGVFFVKILPFFHI